jgi:putative restriction endonuclease
MRRRLESLGVEVVDFEVRQAAFAWLLERVRMHGDVLPWSLLAVGFEWQGRRVPLVSQQGIFKPAVCRLPLSLRTSPEGPYDDHFTGSELVYSYRGKDPQHRENVGLREAMRLRVPLVYFLGVVEGRYLVKWPVFVIRDDPAALRFLVQADELDAVPTRDLEDEPLRRRYETRALRVRLHQRAFRERVIEAYQQQCAMCRLRHVNLLDAAHIKPDSVEGAAQVSNGLALCKIHHAAFDVGVLGIRPTDQRVQVRADVLEEVDGPMLRHGLQQLHDVRLHLPRSAHKKPDPELLRWRWERFQTPA